MGKPFELLLSNWDSRKLTFVALKPNLDAKMLLAMRSTLFFVSTWRHQVPP